MVRIMIKGGVWKNTEDEILKAAVMKYGKMSWARVASLLSRKSAKQCKARWFEWIDPAIKKTDWTREEEEKLLHLAKLMPNQWRTIAPIVGRTAAQCLEHYERLLDMAQEKEGGIDTGEARRLRPGEIDPAPETKPARPDPVHMDEDEKEMLQEARARLANTRGKKAKRKAREKQLEEARRLATLQKRRELKAAGIEHSMRQRKRKHIDYGSEIPFQMTAPAGFYDTTGEKEQAKKVKMDPRFSSGYMHKLEEKRRDKEEEEQRKKDTQKIKKMMKMNLPQQIMAVSKLNDPIPVRKKVPLHLPAPQVSDVELEAIVKMGAPVPRSGGNEITAGLVGEYKQEMPSHTPLRTPSTPAGSDIIMQEARNMVALNSSQTPLLGGENFVLEKGTGFSGSTPQSQRVTTTPNVLMTPEGTTGILSQNASKEGSATPLNSSFRDQLKLNREQDAYMLTPQMSTSSKYEKERAKKAQAELASQLQSLPAPQYSYEISMPNVEEEGESSAKRAVEDAAEIDKKNEIAKIAAQEAEWRSRNEAVKRDLPRPTKLDENVFSCSIADPAINEIFNDVGKVAYDLIKLDDVKFPVASIVGVDGRKKTKKKKLNKIQSNEVIDLHECAEEDLTIAKTLIEEEMKRSNYGPLDTYAMFKFNESWADIHSAMVFSPECKMKVNADEIRNDDMMNSLKLEYVRLRLAIDKIAAKAEKLEARLGLTQGGYMKRADIMTSSIISAHDIVDTAAIEHSCFKRLEEIEVLAIPKRISVAKEALEKEQVIETMLQQVYADLLDETRLMKEKSNG